MNTPCSVMPAHAGTHVAIAATDACGWVSGSRLVNRSVAPLATNKLRSTWVPAYAGMTRWGGTAAKAEKDFATANDIRDELAAKGIVLKDNPDGTTWELAR